MTRFPLRAISLLTLVGYLFQCAPVLAAGQNIPTIGSISKFSAALGDGLNENRPAEFVLRRYPGEKLIPVRMVGGVRMPGLYYLPEGTDLITAISLSGGLSPDVESDSIHITKPATQVHHVVNIEKAMADPKSENPVLSANDTIYIKDKKPVISSNTMLVITAVSSILTIALATMFLTQKK